MVKNLPANAGDLSDLGLISGSGRFTRGGDGSPFLSSLETAMDRGARWAMDLQRVGLEWQHEHVGRFSRPIMTKKSLGWSRRSQTYVDQMFCYYTVIGAHARNQVELHKKKENKIFKISELYGLSFLLYISHRFGSSITGYNHEVCLFWVGWIIKQLVPACKTVLDGWAKQGIFSMYLWSGQTSHDNIS